MHVEIKFNSSLKYSNPINSQIKSGLYHPYSGGEDGIKALNKAYRSFHIPIDTDDRHKTRKYYRFSESYPIIGTHV